MNAPRIAGMFSALFGVALISGIFSAILDVPFWWLFPRVALFSVSILAAVTLITTAFYLIAEGEWPWKW